MHSFNFEQDAAQAGAKLEAAVSRAKTDHSTINKMIIGQFAKNGKPPSDKDWEFIQKREFSERKQLDEEREKVHASPLGRIRTPKRDEIGTTAGTMLLE